MSGAASGKLSSVESTASVSRVLDRGIRIRSVRSRPRVRSFSELPSCDTPREMSHLDGKRTTSTIASLNLFVGGKRNSRRLSTHPSVSAPLMPKRYPDLCHPRGDPSVGVRTADAEEVSRPVPSPREEISPAQVLEGDVLQGEGAHPPVAG